MGTPLRAQKRGFCFVKASTMGDVCTITKQGKHVTAVCVGPLVTLSTEETWLSHVTSSRTESGSMWPCLSWQILNHLEAEEWEIHHMVLKDSVVISLEHSCWGALKLEHIPLVIVNRTISFNSFFSERYFSRSHWSSVTLEGRSTPGVLSVPFAKSCSRALTTSLELPWDTQHSAAWPQRHGLLCLQRISWWICN